MSVTCHQDKFLVCDKNILGNKADSEDINVFFTECCLHYVEWVNVENSKSQKDD